jgi:hypothetical protein
VVSDINNDRSHLNPPTIGKDKIMATVAIHRPVIALNADRRFFTGMAVLLLLLSAAGFARSYYLAHWYGTKELTPLLQLHGAVMTLWILLFLAQTSLVATNRTDVHRRLGMIGLMLAGGVVATSLAAAFVTLGEGRLNKAIPAHVFLVFPIGLALMFLLLVGLAAYFYRDSPTHKRLMLLATIAATATPIARLGIPFLPKGAIGGNLALIPLVIMLGAHDISSLRRIHPATLWGGGFVIAMLPARLLFAQTEAWQGFARWLGA